MEHQLEEIKEFLISDELRSAQVKYSSSNLSEESDLKFNLFQLISDQYLRENLHSDIIKFLLDPKERHGQGDVYFKLFLDLLNRRLSELREKQIDKVDFLNPTVEREDLRIDISILSKEKRKAIIIENKINNANDTDRQLPNYVEKLRKLNYDIVAIFYLTMWGNKTTSEKGWKPGDRDMMKSIPIVPLGAYQKTDVDLFNGWLKIAESRPTKDTGAKTLLKQYMHLLKEIGGNIMSTEGLKEFYSLLTIDGNKNYKILRELESMFEHLGGYLAMELKNKFEQKSNPFKCCGLTTGNPKQVSFGEWYKETSKYLFYIDCDKKNYKLHFLQPDSRWHPDVTAICEKYLGPRVELDRYNKVYEFPEKEQTLYKDIEKILADLQIINSQTKSIHE